jgi:hypothetical protein
MASLTVTKCQRPATIRCDLPGHTFLDGYGQEVCDEFVEGRSVRVAHQRSEMGMGAQHTV